MSACRQKPRGGFTLVELLVVIAIIGILIALLLPAVQAAREAARRSQCSNNLKQIALATHNYHDKHNCLPPGVVDPHGVLSGFGHGDRKWTNWAISILPYIEQKPLYDQYDQKAFNEDPVNRDVVQTFVDVYACPSDLDVNVLERPESGAGSGIEYRMGSYRAMSGRSAGHHNVTNGGWWDGREYDGVPPEWRGIYTTTGYELKPARFASIIDGTGNTLAFGEFHKPLKRVRRGTFWAYSYTSYNKSGATPYSAMLVATDWPRCVAGVPTDNICKRGWGSYHPGGINWALADGSVHFISLTVDMEVFVSLASIQGKETVQLP